MPRAGTTILILGFVALVASAEVRAQESGDMARCAGIEDADARLACYDEVIGRSAPTQSAPEVSKTEPAPEVAAQEPVPEVATKEATPTPLTQEIGAEQIGNRPESEPAVVQGRVTDCQKDANRRWYFVFDNGQVWKERSSSSRRLMFPECGFQVTITKDGFGYKMQIEGEERWIRIGRVR